MSDFYFLLENDYYWIFYCSKLDLCINISKDRRAVKISNSRDNKTKPGTKWLSYDINNGMVDWSDYNYYAMNFQTKEDIALTSFIEHHLPQLRQYYHRALKLLAFI